MKKKPKEHVATVKEAAAIDFNAVPEFAPGTDSRARAIANLHTAADNLRITGTFALAVLGQSKPELVQMVRDTGDEPGTLLENIAQVQASLKLMQEFLDNALARVICAASVVESEQRHH